MESFLQSLALFANAVRNVRGCRETGHHKEKAGRVPGFSSNEASELYGA